MADFITSCATVSDLTTWYTTTVPASVPSGDRYIAELAAGDYDLSGVTWTGKTLASAGQMIVRPQTAAKLNIAGNPARVSTTTGVRLRPTFNAVNSFGSSVADGFQFHDLQISLHQQGTFTFTSGSALHRSACRIASTGGVINFNGASGRAINCLFESTVNAVAATFNGSAAQDSNTFIAWTDRSAVSLNGNFQYATWKNCAALNLASGATADPWPTPPTNFFSGASNNATSFATTGNCPGTSALIGVTAAALVNGSGSSTLDATPATSSVLKAAGVVSSINGGIDWYSTTRSGTTPTIGAVETAAVLPSILSGNVDLGSVAPAGGFGSSASDIGGNVDLGGVAPGGGFGVTPGTINLSLRNANGGTWPLTAVPWLNFARLTDGVSVLSLNNRVTDAASALSINNAALVPGQWYAVSAFHTDGTKMGIWIKQAA